MVTKSQDQPLKAQGLRDQGEAGAGCVWRGEEALQTTTSPAPKHTQLGILPRAPPYSSLDPKKPQKLPGEGSFHENTGREKAPKGKGRGSGGSKDGHLSGTAGPRLEGTGSAQSVRFTVSQQPSTARRGHSLPDAQSE